jgi:anti-sigma regulatory factor (Ser/Thr protein kinase)
MASPMVPDPDVEIVVPAESSAARQARRALAAYHLVQAPLESTLLLLVSELVTNSVRHAGLARDEAIRLRARRDRERTYVEVCDPGHSGEVPHRREMDLLEPGGLGLKLVDEMSDRWGVTHRGNQTCVWFELASAA